MQNSRTTVLSRPLFFKRFNSGRPVATAETNLSGNGTTPCLNCRLGDNSSESIPVSLLSLSLSLARHTRVRPCGPTLPDLVRVTAQLSQCQDSMMQLPLLQSRSHACLQAAALLVSRGDFAVWPFESSRALRLLRLHQHYPATAQTPCRNCRLGG